MDMQTVATLISSIGFPIVAAGGLFWYIVTDTRDMRKVVENNTLALTKVLEHMNKEDEK